MEEFTTIQWILTPFLLWFGYKWMFFWLPAITREYWNEFQEEMRVARAKKEREDDDGIS